ncbi:MAG: orotate phosphoribosyltransferase [Oscillospiraceae bacterium]|nr:orotate phosphoribosyltransferase [Oscillospiraceae bacterium]
MLSKDNINDILKQANVLLEGHFLLTSGKHSEKYLQCANIFRNTKYAEILSKELWERFKDIEVDLIVGPALGAVQMAYEVSRHFGVENFFTERNAEGKMFLGRSFEIKKGAKVLVVEDVITTGGSVREVIQVIKEQGGIVVGVGSIVDRTGGKVDFSVPLKSVITVEVEAFDPLECPICKKTDRPLVKPGSRIFKK